MQSLIKKIGQLSTSPKWFTGLFTGLLIGGIWLVYENVQTAPFIFDDLRQIVNNPAIQIKALTLKNIYRIVTHNPSPTRPLPMLSFACDFIWGHGAVSHFHRINTFIHMACAMALFLLIRQMLILSGEVKKELDIILLSGFTSLIWALHPIQINSVTYIVQRMNSLAALFYLLAFWAYIRARRAHNLKGRLLWAGSCLFFGILSLLSKENAVTLPFFLLLFEGYFFRTWPRRELLTFYGMVLAVGGLLLSLVLAGWGGALGHYLNGLYAIFDFTPLTRVLTETRVLVLYISLVLFPYPARLNLDYQFLISNGMLSPPTTFLSLIALAGLAGLSVYTYQRHKIFSFGLAWFLGNHLIESSVIGLDLVFEHRNYLPSMLLILGSVQVGYAMVLRKRYLWGLCTLLALVLASFTHARNQVYRSPLALWQDCARKSPDLVRPKVNLAMAYANQGNHEKAIWQLQKALKIDPNHPVALNNLGAALCRQGHFLEGIDFFKQSLRVKPNAIDAHYNMAITCIKLSRAIEAATHLTAILKTDAQNRRALALVGDLSALLLKTPDSLKALLTLSQVLPNSAEIHNDLGTFYAQKGQHQKAIMSFTQAIALAPNFSAAYYNLGNSFFRLGDVQKSIPYFEKAIQLRPDYAEAHNNLGIAHAALTQYQEARHHFETALKIQPKYRDARNNLKIVKEKMSF